MIVEAERDAPADRPLPGADDAPRPLDLVELYDAHAARVWRTALALGVERADLDDAVQDVFMVLHRRADDFAGRSSVTTWIYGITRRVAADYRRRARRAPRAGVAHLETAGAPCAEHARQEASQELLALVAQLPVEQREVFVLIELEGMTAPEVASLLGAPVNTVSSRLRLARGHLNEIVLAARAADGGTP
jgi:RNA polymerase sigma-70 factor, ECF subfamily